MKDKKTATMILNGSKKETTVQWSMVQKTIYNGHKIIERNPIHKLHTVAKNCEKRRDKMFQDTVLSASTCAVTLYSARGPLFCATSRYTC